MNEGLILDITRHQLKKSVPDFRAGDTIRVSVRIVEGDKERIQKFEGVCISRHGSGMDETFTVRRVSYGVGMERIFPLHSPRVEGIEVIRHGRVRHSKLYYLRDLTGKKAKLSETRRRRLARGTEVDVAIAHAPEPEAEEPKAEAAPEEPEAPATEEAPAEGAPAEEPATEAPAAGAPAEAAAEPEAEEKSE